MDVPAAIDGRMSAPSSLERLEARILAVTPDRAQGDAWERALCDWINAGRAENWTWAWRWMDWPERARLGLKGDKGVDLVAETADGERVAIQVKFRRDPDDPVTAPEVQKLVGSYRRHFARFALVSNAHRASSGVAEAVGPGDAMLVLREQLEMRPYDWDAPRSVPATPFIPFAFQLQSVEDIRAALVDGGRAQIVMACGTGKTVTMLLAMEALDAERVLVLAPTLREFYSVVWQKSSCQASSQVAPPCTWRMGTTRPAVAICTRDLTSSGLSQVSRNTGGRCSGSMRACARARSSRNVQRSHSSEDTPTPISRSGALSATCSQWLAGAFGRARRSTRLSASSQRR